MSFVTSCSYPFFNSLSDWLDIVQTKYRLRTYPYVEEVSHAGYSFEANGIRSGKRTYYRY